MQRPQGQSSYEPINVTMMPVQVPSYEEKLTQRPIMKGMGEERGKSAALFVN
jgi:hypothetical protein